MHNTQIHMFGEEFRARIFVNHFIDTGRKKLKVDDDNIPTPFFDSNGNRLFGKLELSESEKERRRQESIRCSCSRTRNNILNIALSFSNWCWFVTFTFNGDPENIGKQGITSCVDRYDYDQCCKKIQPFLHTLKYKFPSLAYIIVPERHEDGAYHFHGLFSSELPVSFAGFFKRTGETYHVDGYGLGWTTATKVKSHIACCRYITSYISKDLVAVTKNKRRYWYTHSTIECTIPLKLLISIHKAKELCYFLKNNPSNLYRSIKLIEVGGIRYVEIWANSSFFTDIVSYFCGFTYDDEFYFLGS